MQEKECDFKESTKLALLNKYNSRTFIIALLMIFSANIFLAIDKLTSEDFAKILFTAGAMYGGKRIAESFGGRPNV